MSSTVVIGGGASGLMAAIAVAESGAAVTLVERGGADNLGHKLRLTGKGRCNLTNDCSPDDVLRNVVTNAKFLHSAVRRFPPSDAIAFFRALGVPLKTERGNRVFPQSDRAGDVVDALTRRVAQLPIEVVKRRADAAYVREQLTLQRTVILCTGGLSYPKTGSDGDGFRIAGELGHRVIAASPSLVPLTSDDGFCPELQGFALRNVRVALILGGKRIFEDFGEMQFTHFGVTGPLILSASAHLPANSSGATLAIDLKPAISESELDARLLRDFEKYRNREFRNALTDLAGRSMIPVLVRLSGIAPETRVNAITKQQRRTLLELFKRFTVNISGTRPIDEAVITRGGVDVREVNSATLESKLVPGLYFAGEVLDVDAYTGGFNLQIAWSTAKLAAASASARR
ncbi:MAG: NAD(P)/FAD-dependent oxidoreductase [Oscillospiraceae bacterium]|jgi:predicted Rossmann fold flavoprotein|nr:NAD(P)/FAD-dependent oxidoreductase [Oscillospiraceae bacterium]